MHDVVASCLGEKRTLRCRPAFKVITCGIQRRHLASFRNSPHKRWQIAVLRAQFGIAHGEERGSGGRRRARSLPCDKESPAWRDEDLMVFDDMSC